MMVNEDLAQAHCQLTGKPCCESVAIPAQLAIVFWFGLSQVFTHDVLHSAIYLYIIIRGLLFTFYILQLS